MKKFARICIVAITSGLLFTSCQNFLSSKGVKEEIRNKIEYNNAKTVKVNLSCEKEIGTFFPEGFYSAKLGFAFELQFIPNTENYVIKNKSAMLEAVSRLSEESRAGYVEFTPVEQSLEDKKLGLYRINVKVVKDADDLMIRPLAFERPKVIDIYPPYNPSGVNQDTTINITFNKPVNPDSFGDFSCVTILNSEKENITACYETPFFSNENTVLQIRKLSGNLIIPEISDKNFEDITLAIDFSNIIDAEGIHLSQHDSYTFRVNKNSDKVKPVITSAILKTTSDTSSSYYRTLTGKAFDDWSISSTLDNPCGDFSQNHVGKEIYIEAAGYDKDSRISGMQIVETFYKSIDGKNATLAKKTVVFGVNQFEYSSTDASNNVIYSLNDTYKFASISDGVFMLDISVIDNAGNISVPITYYVIKDTSIESTKIQFLETQIYGDYYPTISWDPDFVYRDIFETVRTVQNGSDTVVLTLTDTSVDTFYAGCESEYDVEMYYGYSRDEINTKVNKENNSFSFTRNPEFLTFINIKFTDAVGNKTNFLRVIPPSPKISSYEKGTVHNDDQGYVDNYVSIVPKNLSVYSSMCDSYGADYFGTFYIIKNNTTPNANYCTSLNGRNQILDYDYENSNFKEYNYYLVIYFCYGDTYWYSVLGDEYVIVNAREQDEQQEINGEISLSTTTSNPTNNFSPYMKDEIQVTIEPCSSSGCYKITLDDYKAHDVDTSNVIYNFECVDDDNKSNKWLFSEPTFYLNSMVKYKVYVYAKEIIGTRYYKSPWCYCYVNGADSYDEQWSFILDSDLYPPSFDSETHWFALDTASYWIEPSLPVDNPETAGYGTIAGMYKDPIDSNYGLIDYYIIPNSNTSANAYSLYTLEDLEFYEKHTLKYKFTDTCLKIPYGHLDEGLYTICLVAKDNAGNYSIKCAPAFNKTLDYKIPITFSYVGTEDDMYKISSVVVEGDDYYIPFENAEELLANSKARDFNIDFYDADNNQWERLTSVDPTFDYRWGYYSSWDFYFEGKQKPVYDGWMKISSPRFELKPSPYYIPYNSIVECGFCLVDYIYTPYEKAKVDPHINEMTVTRKSIYSMANKYKVLCDNSVFAHTMYCSKKLTETTTEYDLALWETKGLETGIVIQDSDFYYTNDNYDDIPDGYYYTTVFHFADGFAQMTDIKQK